MLLCISTFSGGLLDFSYLDAMMSDNGLAKMMQVKNFNVGMINESIYNRKVLFVCVSRKMITLPTSLKSSSLAVFMVIHGSRLVFHGSRWVFMFFCTIQLGLASRRPALA